MNKNECKQVKVYLQEVPDKVVSSLRIRTWYLIQRALLSHTVYGVHFTDVKAGDTQSFIITTECFPEHCILNLFKYLLKIILIYNEIYCNGDV